MDLKEMPMNYKSEDYKPCRKIAVSDWYGALTALAKKGWDSHVSALILPSMPLPSSELCFFFAVF